MFIDVTQPQLMSPTRRRLAVELPPRLGKSDVHEVGLLKKAMLGTRDVTAMCWEAEVPKWFATGWGQRGTITERGTLGPPEIEGTTQEIRHLNRLVSSARDHADSKHVDLLDKICDTESHDSVDHACVRCRMDDALLREEETKLHRSLTMRIGYISHDRYDLRSVVRELANGMAQPLEKQFHDVDTGKKVFASIPTKRPTLLRTITQANHTTATKITLLCPQSSINDKNCNHVWICSKNCLQMANSDWFVHCGI